MIIKDYKNYDYLTLLTKKDVSSEIIKSYKCFGWGVAEIVDDEKYDDTEIITFERKHKMKNKDKLQLLQVHMETQLEKLDKCERYKHSKSTSVGLTCGILLLAIIAYGIYLITQQASLSSRFGGIIIVIVSVVLVICLGLNINKTVKEEQKNYQENTKNIRLKISQSCDSAKKLVVGAQKDDE